MSAPSWQGDRPCSAAEAVQRALSIVGKSGQYVLGTGDYRPRVIGGRLVDTPWTERDDGLIGCDCAGLIVWCYKLRRHRPGYNRGGRFDVSDDLNCNSMLGDAMGAGELFEIATGDPRPGDVIAYPSFYLYDAGGNKLRREDGSAMHWIGHTCIVIGTGRVTNWDWMRPAWHLLDVAQCKGPDGRRPGVIATDGSIWSHHDSVWPKADHRSYLLRARV